MNTDPQNEGTPAPWPELDAGIMQTLDVKQQSFDLLRRYMRGEYEGSYDASEMQDDMVELLDMIETQFATIVGSLYSLAKQYDELREGFKTLAEMPPERLALIQKAAGIR